MRSAGDTLRNYGVRQGEIDTSTKTAVPVWELYRRRPVKHGYVASAYFRRDTLAQVWPKGGK